jgi:prolyl oligopeptidase
MTNQFEEINLFPKIYFHRLGTAQADDRLIYERPDHKDWLINGVVTEDGRYLIIGVRQGSASKNLLFYKDLTNPDSDVVELINQFDASYDFIDNDGDYFWVQTDLDAPRGRVVAIDLSAPDRSNWRELIPETAETLEGVGVLNQQFVASYLKDAHTQVKIFDLDGSYVRNVALPGLGSAGGFGGKRDDTETFYSFTGFTTPTTIYRYNLVTGESTLFRQPIVDFQPDDYETRQVFYTSADGTQVPMFITHRKGLRLDGNNPTYLYGYGGFTVSLTPSFSPSLLVWMEMGGVYAVPNLRGGGEYGEAWHQAGMKQNKQNVFDDFIAAAEWLIANDYTSPPKLAIAHCRLAGAQHQQFDRVGAHQRLRLQQSAQFVHVDRFIPGQNKGFGSIRAELPVGGNVDDRKRLRADR